MHRYYYTLKIKIVNNIRLSFAAVYDSFPGIIVFETDTNLMERQILLNEFFKGVCDLKNSQHR